MVPSGLELLDVDHDRVPRLRTLDVERARLGVVVSGDHDFTRLLARLGERAVKAVLRPGDDPSAGLDPVRRRNAAERVLQLLVLRDVPQLVGSGGQDGPEGDEGDWPGKLEEPHTFTSGGPGHASIELP